MAINYRCEVEIIEDPEVPEGCDGPIVGVKSVRINGTDIGLVAVDGFHLEHVGDRDHATTLTLVLLPSKVTIT